MIDERYFQRNKLCALVFDAPKSMLTASNLLLAQWGMILENNIM